MGEFIEIRRGLTPPAVRTSKLTKVKTSFVMSQTTFEGGEVYGICPRSVLPIRLLDGHYIELTEEQISGVKRKAWVDLYC